MRGKYIIFSRHEAEFPVLIPRQDHFVAHSDITGLHGDTPVAAGFFSVFDGEIRCHGGSISLGLNSRGKVDEEILEKFCFT